MQQNELDHINELYLIKQKLSLYNDFYLVIMNFRLPYNPVNILQFSKCAEIYTEVHMANNSL